MNRYYNEFGNFAAKSAHLSACSEANMLLQLKFLEYSLTLNHQKYRKLCLDLILYFVDTLDTLWHTHEISKDLD